MEAKADAPEPTLEEITYKRAKKKPSNQLSLTDQIDQLPTEEIHYDLTEDEKICPQCDGSLHQMSETVRKEVVFVPASVKVIKHIQKVYACRTCEANHESSPVIQAGMPKPAFPKSVASPSLVAHIMNRKYAEAVPLYRQEGQWKHLGLVLSRQNMANWVIQGSNRWLEPLYERLHNHLLKSDYLHADETPLQVLKEEGRTASQNSYMWLYASNEYDEHPVFLYDYQTTRASKHPKKFLKGFKGYLQTDGYSGYNDIPDVNLIGCLAHARRKFIDAIDAAPKDVDLSKSAATVGRQYCDRLFALQKNMKELPREEWKDYRDKHFPEVFENFHEWLLVTKKSALPKSKLGKAIQYTLNEWRKYKPMLLDERYTLSNNRAERSIKPFIIGRKNWMFANTSSGARSSAVVYSIIETAKANRLSPFDYLNYIFEKAPNIDLSDPNQLDQLLPWSEQVKSNCTSPLSK